MVQYSDKLLNYKMPFGKRSMLFMKAKERFLKYVTFDTTSNSNADTVPTTSSQNVLAQYLAQELKDLGLSEVRTNDKAFVYGSIPASKGKENLPALGFIAHIDTSEDASGVNIKARIHEKYTGGTIVLNSEKNITMSPKEYPSLRRYVGDDLIVTDGTTLLGADDKAGVAEIVTMAERLIKNPEIPHPAIKIAFTPDEEVGKGVEHFDVAGFDAAYAFTVDGGTLGELEYENFNAAAITVTVNGTSIHPGSSKNAMVNASLLGMEFHSMLPVEQNPRYTEGYEGFFHLGEFKGVVEHAQLHYILRDHDQEKFDIKKQTLEQITAYLNEKYGKGTFELSIKDSYKNMKNKIIPHMHLIDNAKKAFGRCGVEAQIVPIRGGTDGARLSFMGLPCPNLSTGGENFHGRFEYISVQSLEKMAEVLVHIAQVYGE